MVSNSRWSMHLLVTVKREWDAYVYTGRHALLSISNIPQSNTCVSELLFGKWSITLLVCYSSLITTSCTWKPSLFVLLLWLNIFSSTGYDETRFEHIKKLSKLETSYQNWEQCYQHRVVTFSVKSSPINLYKYWVKIWANQIMYTLNWVILHSVLKAVKQMILQLNS